MANLKIKEVKNKDDTLAFKCWDMPDGSNLPLKIKNPNTKLTELEYKDGDIIISSYPKTGTHWLRDSLSMLLNGNTAISWSSTMLDFAPLDGYKSQVSRRIAHTHLHPDYLSDSHKKNAKFIITVRNPKDVAVSMWYHFRKSVNIKMQATWDQFFDLFSKNQVPYGGFFDHYRAWKEFILSNAGNALVVYYEDMHKDYQKELRRIADFVGAYVTEDIIAQITEKGQQIQLIHDEALKLPDVQAKLKTMTTDGSLPFYRQGKVGDWKNRFTVAQNEMYDAIIEKEMKGFVFNFDYSLK